jgi:penicillin amidase
MAKRSLDLALLLCCTSSMALAVRGWLVAAPAETAVGVSVAMASGLAALAIGRLKASLPILAGRLVLSGLEAPVQIVRDAGGVPTITGLHRTDIAQATGFLHAQERFFQMDLQRRTAAGELAVLFGARALDHDRGARVHRFRHRAEAIVAALTEAERSILDAYVRGVNQGLTALRSRPFEYWLLRARPAAWRAEDTILVIHAMFLGLQDGTGAVKRYRDDVHHRLGPALATFLFPDGSPSDCALDESLLEPDPTPATRPQGLDPADPRKTSLQETASPGSNCFAIAGALSHHGAAIVANDMHLALRLPTIWYRARLYSPVDESHPEQFVYDITGLTLPGVPMMVTGSNGRIAWGFSNACVDTGDVVVLEPSETNPERYTSPDGDQILDRTTEPLRSKGGRDDIVVVEESRWGPVIGTDGQDRKLAYRWIAHDLSAVNLRGLLALERAESTEAALAIAETIGMPHQNIVVGDTAGVIGWTITGRLPKRIGHDGRVPTSWADGTRGWSGSLLAHERPIVITPADHRIWTANTRVAGIESFATLGFGDYAHGARTGQIKAGLFAQWRFDEKALLAIQLDATARVLDRWQRLLRVALNDRIHRKGSTDLIARIEPWCNEAQPDAVGYRIVRTFRTELIGSIYAAFLGPLWPSATDAMPQIKRPLTHQIDEPAWRLVMEQPPHLVPPGFAGWDAVIEAAVEKTMDAVAASGGSETFTWGAVNRPGIRHPLSAAIPGLWRLLDPPNDPAAGDIYQPRVASPGFGAVSRCVVAPGHEEDGIFHMPGSQSGHPLSPYDRCRHEDWAAGRPSPFLPGPARWRLDLTPS